jgi:hypothetical protein
VTSCPLISVINLDMNNIKSINAEMSLLSGEKILGPLGTSLYACFFVTHDMDHTLPMLLIKSSNVVNVGCWSMPVCF